MGMTTRERVLATLHREQRDRVPFDIWYTPEVRDQLLSYFNLTKESDLWRQLEIDKIVMMETPYTQLKPSSLDDQGRVLTFNEWGSATIVVDHGSGGIYEEVVHFPLKEAESVEEIETYSFADPTLYDYDNLNYQCTTEYSEWTRMLTFVSIFEIYSKLRPFDLSLMDLYIEVDLAHALISKILEVQKKYIELSFEATNNAIDIVYLSDDMGMQDRLLIKEEVWEQFFKEPYRQLIDLIHSKGALAFYHSDGAAYPILKQMVDLGVDVINPIQHTCPGMEREHLVKSLGERVAFHGAVENQHILPFGTPQMVQQEVRENIATLGSKGSYVCAPCHNLQIGTPIENILALYRCDRSLL